MAKIPGVSTVIAEIKGETPIDHKEGAEHGTVACIVNHGNFEDNPALLQGDEGALRDLKINKLMIKFNTEQVTRAGHDVMLSVYIPASNQTVEAIMEKSMVPVIKRFTQFVKGLFQRVGSFLHLIPDTPIDDLGVTGCRVALSKNAGGERIVTGIMSGDANKALREMNMEEKK